MNFIIAPAAKKDILKQFEYYLLNDSLDPATCFLDAIDASIGTLCRPPYIGAPRPLKNPSLLGLRFWAVKGFEDILIFYTVRDDLLRIIRFLHGRRNLKRILEGEKHEEAPN